MLGLFFILHHRNGRTVSFMTCSPSDVKGNLTRGTAPGKTGRPLLDGMAGSPRGVCTAIGCLARFGRLVGLLGLDMLNGRELIVHGLSAVLTCWQHPLKILLFIPVCGMYFTWSRLGELRISRTELFVQVCSHCSPHLKQLRSKSLTSKWHYKIFYFCSLLISFLVV